MEFIFYFIRDYFILDAHPFRILIAIHESSTRHTLSSWRSALSFFSESISVWSSPYSPHVLLVVSDLESNDLIYNIPHAYFSTVSATRLNTTKLPFVPSDKQRNLGESKETASTIYRLWTETSIDLTLYPSPWIIYLVSIEKDKRHTLSVFQTFIDRLACTRRWFLSLLEQHYSYYTFRDYSKFLPGNRRYGPSIIYFNTLY